MAKDFQTGGEHAPGKNNTDANGRVVPVGLEFVSPYGADPTKVTFDNSSPLHSDEVSPQRVQTGK